MSEPSQEAKQAAEEKGYKPNNASYYTFCEGFDTATAKTREELKQLKREQQVLLDIHAALGIKWGQDPYAVINELKQLAHKQPSVRELEDRPKPIPGPWLAHQSENPKHPEEWDIYEGGKNGYSVIGDGFITEDQAKEITLRHNLAIDTATVDVEKIARKIEVAIDWLSHLGPTFAGEYSQNKNWKAQEVLRSAIEDIAVLAQARAPLVEALEKLHYMAKDSLDRRDSANTIWSDVVLRITSAALTGTGEAGNFSRKDRQQQRKRRVMTMLDKPITDPVTYRKPIAALHNGREVKLLAHGNQEGKSPVFQFCDTETGTTGWESQSQFRIIDSSIMPGNSIKRIWSEQGQQHNQQQQTR